ncbi:ribulose-1,5 bisphosphate carboxylase oxygenase large subunit N-chloroplastic [Micractinium conductrix]|uniref:Ribulose-1,5 bisphosphate carboxylase oxygenase large subunit N-chloroplastic n=1 Tax=Micractinium conductrix TaxID=554055 RepID=A0A2P6V4L4_9CHLO|nr:ribulose-1,5 bisphosphate carboxylase oxygenase large subunit N-chloroplastic [Micractinium conductrix]|eukprot:PSC69026.1 ribulose-1,5 bisphosphate carboxylase oxygenase large subunit N-chloroplastic [Micractinium conductrix]
MPACLVVDYAAGLRVPPGAWPRLRKGVQKDDSLPWDVLQALALLDGLAGGGDAFWERYSNAVLPAPTQLTLPLCFPPALLPELQHEAIASAAAVQQQRLAGLFPGLSSSMAADGPTWLQWGFGCVRSRAFKLGPDCFASVPFLDLANHAPGQPSCDFRLSSDGSAVQLVALQELAPGQEATISYTGADDTTNQRLMAQYGFVLPGSPADRLAFDALPDGQDGAGAPGNRHQAPLLSLDRMLDRLGERQAVVFSGQDPYAFAALKSLPFAADEGDAAELDAQLALTGQLAGELAAEAAGWPTTLDQDSRLLQGWREAAAAGSGTDARLVAAVEYRLQRKALMLRAPADQ